MKLLQLKMFYSFIVISLRLQCLTNLNIFCFIDRLVRTRIVDAAETAFHHIFICTDSLVWCNSAKINVINFV